MYKNPWGRARVATFKYDYEFHSTSNDPSRQIRNATLHDIDPERHPRHPGPSEANKPSKARKRPSGLIFEALGTPFANYPFSYYRAKDGRYLLQPINKDMMDPVSTKTDPFDDLGAPGDPAPDPPVHLWYAYWRFRAVKDYEGWLSVCPDPLDDSLPVEAPAGPSASNNIPRSTVNPGKHSRPSKQKAKGIRSGRSTQDHRGWLSVSPDPPAATLPAKPPAGPSTSNNVFSDKADAGRRSGSSSQYQEVRTNIHRPSVPEDTLPLQKHIRFSELPSRWSKAPDRPSGRTFIPDDPTNPPPVDDLARDLDDTEHAHGLSTEEIPLAWFSKRALEDWRE